MLGVTHTTIQNDLDNGNKLPERENIISDFEADIKVNGNNLPPPQKSWFEKDGQKVAEISVQ